MKSISLVALVIWLLPQNLLAATGGVEQAVESLNLTLTLPQDWTAVGSNDFDRQIKAPLEKKNSQNSTMVIRPLNAYKQPSTEAVILISQLLQKFPSSQPSKELAQTFAKELAAKGQLDTDQIQVAGRPAHLLRLIGKSLVTLKVIGENQKGQVYQIDMIASEVNFNQVSNTFQTILDSLKIAP